MSSPAIFFQGEMQLAGWGETHNGGCKITFWVADSATMAPFKYATIRKGKTAGQRFAVVFVELYDTTEKPVRHASNDAHLMITGDDFVEWVNGTVKNAGDWDTDKVRRWAKHQIGVESLSELDRDPAAVVRFHDILRKPFAAWNLEDPSTDAPEEE